MLDRAVLRRGRVRAFTYWGQTEEELRLDTKAFDNPLHYGRTNTVAEKAYLLTPGAEWEFKAVVEPHRAHELRDLEHAHHVPACRGPDQRESINCRYGSQGAINWLPSAAPVCSVVHNQKRLPPTKLSDSPAGASNGIASATPAKQWRHAPPLPFI